MDFLWTKDIKPPQFKELDGDVTTDILVIGGGMAGILCALKLQQIGANYVLVEGKEIGGGITKGTTAVLTAQHDTLYFDMIKKFGREKSKLYLEANLRAVERFRELSQNIPCDFEDMPSIMYSLNDSDLIEREAEALRTLGYSPEITKTVPMPFPVAGAIVYPNMAQFHPLKFLYSVAKDLNIYENTFVEKLEGTTAFTEHGNIKAKKVIVATHFPFINRHGMYFTKLYQQRTYVIALEKAPKLNCSIMDVAENGIYLRNYNDLLLVGGGDNRTGEKGRNFEVLRDFIKRYLPNAVERYAWANQDCMSLDGMPYIGEYSAGFDDVYVATGFNLWGMTTSMVAAELLSDMVMGRENPLSEVFTSGRSMISTQLFANMGTTFIDFMVPTTKRCSHMGAALKWNAVERSWDCPCHGSRFNMEGHIIDNPAIKNSKV